MPEGAEEYVVLSGVRGLVDHQVPERGLRSTSRGIGEAVSGARVTVQALDRADVNDAARDPDLRLARTMPVKLLEPVAASVDAEVHSAWGISAVGADTSSCDGRDVKVAILDTGIAADHPAFLGMSLTERDYTGDGNGDRNGHGTHAASTLFGRDVDGIRIGIARGVRDVLVAKVLSDGGGGTTAATFRALQDALDFGAKVISMSLGFDAPGLTQRLIAKGWPAELATSRALEAYGANLRLFDALMAVVRARVAFDDGAVIVAATGNESRAAYQLAASLPSAAEGVISVGAAARVDGARLTIAEFSNRPPVISAPGVSILGASHRGGLKPMSGTSMATPHVAGVAALWWQHKRRGTTLATAPVVTAALREHADRSAFATGVADADCGLGMVRAPR